MPMNIFPSTPKHIHVVKGDDYATIDLTSLTVRESYNVQLTAYRFICRGTGIEWPELDYHLSIEAMLTEGRLAKAA